MLPRNSPCPCGSGRKYKHCCLNVSRPRSSTTAVTSHPSTRILTTAEISIHKEIDHIRVSAECGDARIVTLGSLIFFSTETGDAWVLDADDKLAACLMKNFAPRDIRVTETPTNFIIGWTGEFELEDRVLTISDSVGHVVAYAGDIERMISRAMRQAASR